MVIDRHETIAPLFWYLFRPHQATRRDDNHAAGGFNVALYPDHTLVFCKFDGLNQLVDRCTFQLPAEVTGRYMMILDSQSWWMGKLPREIKADGRASYTSLFGFTRQHPLFSCEDIDTLVLSPFNSQRGMYARRLRGMLECLSEMLYDYGILMGVDSFDWDWQYIRPLEHMGGMQQTAPQPMQSWQYTAAQQPQDASYAYEQDRMAQ